MAPFNYGNGEFSAANIIANLNERSRIHAAHIASIFDLCLNGCWYTNQDWDVLGAAIGELAKDEFRDVKEYEAGWVAKQEKRRAHIAAAKKWAWAELNAA